MICDYIKSDLIRKIDYFENRVDLDTVDHVSLWKDLDRYFHSIPVGLNVIKKGNALFRGRPTEAGPSFKLVDDFSFVPLDIKAECKVFGRCNNPTQSLFYSARNLDVAQMECLTHYVDCKIGSLSFGTWIAQEDITIADIILHEIEDIKTASVDAKREHFHNLLKPKLNDEQFECMKMVLGFFGRQFAKSKIPNHRHYLYSVYLTNRLLKLEPDGNKIAGLQYPSIAMRYQGDNVVLQPEVLINQKLKLVETIEVMSAIGGGKLECRITNRSKKIEDGKITWYANDTIHCDSFVKELEKPPIERGGRGSIIVEIGFEKEKFLSVAKEMNINVPSDSAIEFTLTEQCEKLIQNYCNIIYREGSFASCRISEKENKIVCKTPPGFLSNFKGEIFFARGGATYTYKKLDNVRIGLIPASREEFEE